MTATSSFIGGSPIKVTSGWTESLLLSGKIKVHRIFWEGPTLESTSSLIITKRLTGATMEYVNVKCETSGQSKKVEINDWWDSPYIKCVPTGTLFIYLDRRS